VQLRKLELPGHHHRQRLDEKGTARKIQGMVLLVSSKKDRCEA